MLISETLTSHDNLRTDFNNGLIIQDNRFFCGEILLTRLGINKRQ